MKRVTSLDRPSPEDAANIRLALSVLPHVRATLISQNTRDSLDMTDAAIGTQYIAYPTTQKTIEYGRTDRPGRTLRLSIWLRRADLSDDCGGYMPAELFKLDEQ